MLAFARTGSAAGAPIGDLMWAGAVGTVLSLLALWVFTAHRAGRISWLRRLADWSSAQSGLPAFAAMPIAVAAGSLLTAGFGFYWDVAKHIDTGRDAGPFGTPAHWPILIGLMGITLAGLLAIVLGSERDEVPTSVRLSEGWHAPLGGVLIFMCGALALVGFPLDDLWHTLFGQDVTLWGPTHILMVGGASLSALGTWVLLIEGRRVGGTAANALLGRFVAVSEYLLAGAFLIGMSTLQGEFDYGVPQFQLVYQPVMIAFAAGLVLVAARIRLGRGAALAAAAFHSLAFGAASLAIAKGFGLSTLHFPLYVAEAAIVELVAFAPLADPRKWPLRFGLAAGALIGTVGVAAEWGWTHVWMPLPWTAPAPACCRVSRMSSEAPAGPCRWRAPRSSSASPTRCR